MKEVFLDNLPRLIKNIDWSNSIGFEVPFVCDDVKGSVEIIDYYIKNNKGRITTRYNNLIYSITTESFKRGGIAYCIGRKVRGYKYELGEVAKTNTGSITILNKFKDRKNKKSYVYKCNLDINIDIITETELNKGGGCNICFGHKVLIGCNDIWTTHPDVAKLLKNREDGYLVSKGSGKKCEFVCPNCGNEKYLTIGWVTNRGFSCLECGDGLSYPSKIMFGVLRQLNINFIAEYTPLWSSNKRYDYFIPKFDIIIEINGLQHYEGGFESASGRTLNEEKQNDEIKNTLAINNGVLNKNYITIDCRNSDLDFIKKNILESDLKETFDLTKIDWLECDKHACGSLVKDVCDLWNNVTRDTLEISNITKLHRSTVIKNLHKGKSIGLCDYDPQCNFKRKVICINTSNMFESIRSASYYYGIKSTSNISANCRGKRNYAGIHPETGDGLIWMYYDEYLKINNKNAPKEENDEEKERHN